MLCMHVCMQKEVYTYKLLASSVKVQALLCSQMSDRQTPPVMHCCVPLLPCSWLKFMLVILHGIEILGKVPRERKEILNAEAWNGDLGCVKPKAWLADLVAIFVAVQTAAYVKRDPTMVH